MAYDRAPLSPSRGVHAGTAQDMAAHRAAGSPRGWHQAAELGVGAGERVSRHGHHHHCAKRNTPASLPGVTDQDLRRSAAWLSNRRHLRGVIRAVITNPPLQANCRGNDQGKASC
jgi:hypothetical protein